MCSSDLEVQEHAEELLKEMSLSSYYDEVALKGLELAVRDLARGVLTRPQVERIKDAVTTLVTELADGAKSRSNASPGEDHWTTPRPRSWRNSWRSMAWARKSLRMRQCHVTQSASLGGKASQWSAFAIST